MCQTDTVQFSVFVTILRITWEHFLDNSCIKTVIFHDCLDFQYNGITSLIKY